MQAIVGFYKMPTIACILVLTAIVGIWIFANDRWHTGDKMIVRTPYELALLAKERRKSLKMTQAQLAERIGSSREWVRQFETGKSRLDAGLAFRALIALGITLDARFSKKHGPFPLDIVEPPRD